MLKEILERIEAGRTAEAEELALARSRTHPDDAGCWSLLALLAARRGDLAAASLRLDAAIRLAPGDPGLWLNRGNLERLQGRREEASRAYRRALALAPAHTGAEFGLAALAEESGRWAEAESGYRRILANAPAHAEALHNLARLLAATPGGSPEEAAELYARATEAAPLQVESWRNRAHLLRRLERDEEAVACYETVLRLSPGDATSRHLRDALRGESPERADPAYVRRLFDRFASTYDDEVTEELGYEGAARLATWLAASYREASPNDDSPLRLLDLGCGTGLFLQHFLGLCGRAVSATGVDLSAAMLEKAEMRGLYSRLEAGDILEYLNAGAEEYDVLAAADVFLYFGDLSALLAACQRRLRRGGRLAFTVEMEADAAGGRGGKRVEGTMTAGGSSASRHVEGAYRLARTGRFVHDDSALGRSLVEVGLAPIVWERAPLRREAGAVVEGLYVVATRP